MKKRGKILIGGQQINGKIDTVKRSKRITIQMDQKTGVTTTEN